LEVKIDMNMSNTHGVGIPALVIFLRGSAGLSDDLVDEVEKICLLCRPSYVEMLPPSGILLVYAGALLEKSLNGERVLPLFQALEIDKRVATLGTNRGEVIGELSNDGRFVFPPLGIALNVAMQNSRRQMNL